MTHPNLPEQIESEEQLDDLLTTPGTSLIEFIKTVSSPLLVLGAGGKMGPTLAVLAKRAAEAARHPLEVIAASRFSDQSAKQWLETRGVKTLSCDLLDRDALARLPEARNLIYLVGMKFGTAQNPSATWVMNTVVPAWVAERFPGARMVALSTGNVYQLSAVERGGSIETDSLTPLGEYANAAVGRERVFEFFSRRAGTPIALLRLFYAIDLRYGVLMDIARKVHAGQPIPLGNGFFNCIWQGDANEMVLRALDLASSPPAVFNLCRPEVFPVRKVATRLGELLNRPPQFTGTESPTALLGNADGICKALGAPGVTLDIMSVWAAAWVKSGGRSLGKPTHFEVRDGRY